MRARAELLPEPKEFDWSPALIRMLRGKRTQARFGTLIGVPKNTVWRWEAGYAKPLTKHLDVLTRVARAERFLEDWQLVGSVTLIGDLEEGSKQIAGAFKKSLRRTSKQLVG
ncbi:MAG TPA: hypothetical protein VG778_04030 [Blastocatellia bacterium]|nr:hypothetical protein [Blastocatellia bacterium]